jgi:hypothetical protein
MLKLLILLLVCYVTMVGLLYAMQRKLLYFPSTVIGTPDQHQLSGFTDLRLKTTDGVSIQTWYKQAAEGFPTIAYFHGNGGNIGGRALIYDTLVQQGFGVMALSYRGYGASEGSPTESGLYEDARTALGYLMVTQQLPPEQIILFGESLGSGVAVQMALEFPVGMLALQSPYRSVAERAAEIYPWVPVKLLIKDRFPSIEKIGKVTAPVLILHGERDEVIPAAHGRSIYEATRATKRAHFMPHVNHNDFDSRVVSSHLLDYATELGLIRGYAKQN